MPRTANRQYLTARAMLRDAWLARSWRWSCLSLREQRDRHVYFRPSEELTDSNALESRRQVGAQDPSLPHRAGRALKHFVALVQPIPVDVPAKDREIIARPVLRPRIETAKLARALLDLARRDLEGEVTPAPMDDAARRRQFEALIEQSRDHIRSDSQDEPDSSPPHRAA